MCGDFPFEFDLPWQWSPSDLHWQNAWPISSWPRRQHRISSWYDRPDSVGNRKKEYMKVLQYYLEVFIYYSVVLLKYTIVTILHVKNHVLSIPRAEAGWRALPLGPLQALAASETWRSRHRRVERPQINTGHDVSRRVTTSAVGSLTRTTKRGGDFDFDSKDS